MLMNMRYLNTINPRIILALCLFAFAPSLLLKAAVTDQEKIYLESFGWLVGQQSGIAQLGLSDEEMESVLVGLRQAARAEEPPHNIQLVGPDMNTFLKDKAEANQENYQKKMEAAQQRAEADASEAAKVNKNKAAQYITEVADSNDDIYRTKSGLFYLILDSGNENKPSATDRVTVNYEGKLINGEMFDSSIKRGKPATFELNRVIPGWTEGLQLIGEGGKIRLYVPSDLAYGDTGRPGIPPGAMLIFDVDLLSVEKAEKKTAVTPAVSSEDAVKPEAEKLEASQDSE